MEDIIKNEKPDKLIAGYDYSTKFPFSKTIHLWCKRKLTSLSGDTNGILKEMIAESEKAVPVIADKLSPETIEK